jgi:hypothetical protein
MKIGIIGAGMIGGTLGRLWHQAGHEVYFGTRHPADLKPLVAELGERARTGSAENVAQWADTILLAVPLMAVPPIADVIASAVRNKVILDAGNPYPRRDGAAAEEALRHPAGSTGWVASHFPGARVVKAFNTVNYRVLQREAHRVPDDGVGIPLSGDDESALATAELLVRDAGFSPVRVGGLATGKQFEPGAAIYNTGMRASEITRALGLAGEK